ncbi:MAG: hypothetical protein HN948_00555 [Clostridia bacterium]|jgi:hypothetical protein|nr:hypothetical protein [Clostridia bacterium]MBT7121478.1 hypothetical protein [Clostridia bacterium]
MKFIKRIFKRLFGRKLALNRRTFCSPPSKYSKKIARIAGSIDSDNTADGEVELKTLKLLGFKQENIQIFAQESDTIILAEKQIDIKRNAVTLKVISIRGSDVAFTENAFKDWISNFDVGKLFKGAEHKGFAQSTDLITSSREFQNFIKNRKDTIFLVTGHSRGGAIAAEIMNHMLKELDFPGDNIYGYTFGAPSTIRGEDEVDTRIGELVGLHQIENENDNVPKLPPQAWGWSNRGTVHTISFPGKMFEAHSLKSYVRFL